MNTQTDAHATSQRKVMKDIFGIVLFVLGVIIGAALLNAYVFQSFNVEGPSMEPTLHTSERLIANKTVVTFNKLSGKTYVPSRGEIVVFLNPLAQEGQPEKHLVKRVIGLPGERVLVKDGSMTVFNASQPDGFNPDNSLKGPKHPTSGDIDVKLNNNEIFVAGDNRIENFSFDSRNGLGSIPLQNVEGPVYARVWPMSKFQIF